MKVKVPCRALTWSRVPHHVRVADAIRVDQQFQDCRKFALDFGMTEASPGGGTNKGPVVNALGDSPRGHRRLERASHKTHGNRDYRPVRPRLVTQHMRRADMTVTSAGHEITVYSTVPACLLLGDSLTSVITKGPTGHSIARHATDLEWHMRRRPDPRLHHHGNNCAGMPQVKADLHLRLIT